MALVVFFQEDEDVPIVYRNLKIFCETDPWPIHLALKLSHLFNAKFFFTRKA